MSLHLHGLCDTGYSKQQIACVYVTHVIATYTKNGCVAMYAIYPESAYTISAMFVNIIILSVWTGDSYLFTNNFHN